MHLIRRCWVSKVKDIICNVEYGGVIVPNTIIVELAFFLICLDIGWQSTTNILRLTAGNKTPVLSVKCICDSCGERIPLRLQVPVISYVMCRGRCRNCSAHIPPITIILELAVTTVMYGIIVLFDFNYLGVTISFLYYEVVKIAVIIIKKKREQEFKKQYLISVISMIPFFLCSLFVSFIHIAVAG